MLCLLFSLGLTADDKKETLETSQPIKSAKKNDVSFIVLGKTPAYTQDVLGIIHHKKHYAFGEIFLNDKGKLKKATLKTPEGSRLDYMPFSYDGRVWKIERQDFKNQQAMDAAFPDGEYLFDITTANGEQYLQKVNLRFREEAPGYTQPISIYFYQNEKRVDQNEIDPNKNLIVRWSEFSKGRHDPNGIADDLIFAMSFDCFGKSFARSALPFIETPALTYADKQFRIPADRLSPGHPYKIVVEHAELVETQIGQGGLKSLATFPSVTTAMFTTTGAKNLNCLKTTD